MTVFDIYSFLNKIAPFEAALSFDNCGLLIGNEQAEVSRVLICLDVTREICRKAVAQSAELIISHHPVIFHGLKRITEDSVAAQLLKSGISVISAHTNLDFAERGVNHQLAKACGILPKTLRRFPEEAALQTEGFGLYGTLPAPMSAEDFVLYVKQSLGANRVVYTDGGKMIQTAAVSCGAGSFLLEEALKAGADALITGEVKHHELILAAESGFTLIAAGHYETEQVILKPLQAMLSAEFPTVAFEVVGSNPACVL